MDEFFLIEAQAGDKGNPKVTGMAYSGGKINLSGWRHPVVVDLAGLQMPDPVPLLANHENRTTSRVGIVMARVENGSLLIEGEVFSTNGQAQGIVEQAKAGADWQLSIGAEVQQAELVAKGQVREVNGIKQEGPFYHVKAAVLREVSVVAVGADASTRMKVAARFALTGFQEDQVMQNDQQSNKQPGVAAGGNLTQPSGGAAPAPQNPAGENGGNSAPAQQHPAITASGDPAQQTAPAAPAVSPEIIRAEAESAIRAERGRVTEIQAICGGEFPKIEQEAISTGWTIDRTRAIVLKAIRDGRPQSEVGIVVASEVTPLETSATLEAALCLRSGIGEEELVTQYGERTVTRARKEQDISLQQLFAECAKIEGKSTPRSFGNDTVRAAFSTVSLPGILNNVANKRLMKSFQAQPIVATKLCSEGELTDFKESERYRLTDVGDLEPVAPDGEIKHGGLKEDKAVNRLDTYGKVFALTRQMIFNDDLGGFLKVPDGMGGRSARKIDQLFFTRLMSNPGSLFSTTHKNYKTGTDSALSGDSLASAIQAFMDQTDADGQPINVNPKFLLVPTSLKITARELLNSITFIATNPAGKMRLPTYNALAEEDLTIVVSPYLSNTNYAGASTKAWYLFADPTIVDTFEIGYLRGRRTPVVEQGESDFDTLGIKFRVFFDLGVREQDWRGVLMAKGE